MVICWNLIRRDVHNSNLRICMCVELLKEYATYNRFHLPVSICLNFYEYSILIYRDRF